MILKPIEYVKEPPILMVTNPAGVCMPLKIDITAPAITAGSEADLILSYWTDQQTTIPLPNPNAIDKTGSYYSWVKKMGVWCC